MSTASFVFMDDSDFERAQVADELPEVAVVSAAGDPAHLVDALLRDGWFDVVTLTDTDRERPELYRNRALRQDFSTGFTSSEQFLRALELRVKVAPATPYTVGRIAQLAARTNQFNLTGIRYDEMATRRMSEDEGHLVLAVSVADRFGDEGVVGALWVERTPEVWRVTNLVLSCRVLSRGVERAAVGRLAAEAAAAGAGLIEGHFRRSDRNGVAPASGPAPDSPPPPTRRRTRTGPGSSRSTRRSRRGSPRNGSRSTTRRRGRMSDSGSTEEKVTEIVADVLGADPRRSPRTPRSREWAGTA
ncbi:hypothetical protein NQP46_18950 [Streptomyces albus]|nr:hypothetical protein NQP46_18950 [Streptomyces albus]